MVGSTSSQRTAQLDKAERDHLEAVVTEMRERVEDNVRFQLTQQGLDQRPTDTPTDDTTASLVSAIELELVDGDAWAEGFEKYVTGVGYTIVNRLAALRCLELRGFVDEEVTVFKEDGLTPAAETLVHEEFLLEDEAILEAYHRECDELAQEIEILFDRSTPYSLVDPDDDTFAALCGLLDDVPDAVWRADDVLGWVYEYYNVKLLDDLRRKGSRVGLDPEDVPPANQFYTPHWVVRMLTDNSLGKLYLEHTGELQDVVDRQATLSPDERKHRPLSPDESPDIAEFCTYLVPSEEGGEPTEFDHPADLQVIDPACGSGHFLLYAFDVLERIWRAETDRDHAEIPRQILKHNLYGVDLDMRACQLAAFNLYLKGRTRAETEGADGFEMPEVGIVCADATVADVDGVEAVFEEVAGDDSEVEQALERILDAFEEVNGLGSLLDVRGTLGELFDDDSDVDGVQLTLGDDPRESHTLGQVLRSLREAVDDHRESESFLAQDLRSFVRLLEILAQEYDVALMNPPYGSRNRMPKRIRNYINDRYEYTPEFYINFFEVCNRLAKEDGRIGILVPRSFMFKRRFEDFRSDFVGGAGTFDFLAEYGLGILDNATVRTAGTTIRKTSDATEKGQFLRLHDVPSEDKEDTFLDTISDERNTDIKRQYTVSSAALAEVPGNPISYWTPSQVRDLHSSEWKLDPDAARVEGTAVARAANGMNTGDNSRFLSHLWAVEGNSQFIPYAKGGSDAWIIPVSNIMINWAQNGTEVSRFSGSVLKNADLFGREGLTWTYAKETGRRFGYFPGGGAFDGKGSMLFPKDIDPWVMMGVLNSSLYHNLFLSLTPERDWQVGDVGRIPWQEDLELDAIGDLAKEQFQAMSRNHVHDPTSQYYIGPELLPARAVTAFFYDHPHPDGHQMASFDLQKSFPDDPAQSIVESASGARQMELIRRNRLEKLSNEIDTVIYEQLGISDQTRRAIETEIFLRTSEAPDDRDVPAPESVPEPPDDIDQQVKDLVHHFAMEAVQTDPDGIVPLHSGADHADMVDCIVDQFEDAYGEYAEDRLIEVDEILGTEAAAEEAYPNLRAFIAQDLFDYHVDRMENTPIVWKLTTDRLIADSVGTGFACFVDYHSLDSGLLDRLATQYLEPRKADLRERRSAASRRRSDDSLSASEQADAAQQYERCASGLDQISVFEDVLQELGSTSERAFDDADRQLVTDLAPKVATFREETSNRVETLAQLRERTSEAWFKDTFSAKFWEGIEEWRQEWLDALDELEAACEAYDTPADEAVEAHLADLFDYFSERVKGSDHYSSTGILFLTYYFEREGAEFLDDDGQPFETLTEDERLLASLASGLDDPSVVDDASLEAIADDEGVVVEDLPAIAAFKALAEEIDDRCQTISDRLPTEWRDRALAEITTEGYHPNHKHGVEINVTPLSDHDIVPETVDEKVL